MKYYLYKKNAEAVSHSTNTKYEVHRFSPNPFRLTIKNEVIGLKACLARLKLYLMSHGKMHIYYVTSDDNCVVHTSCVVGKCSKYEYLKKNDFRIGPCSTLRTHRGKGIYTTVLKHIVSQYTEDTVFYIAVAENNISSIKGIENAGFSFCGVISKTSVLKHHFVSEENN